MILCVGSYLTSPQTAVKPDTVILTPLSMAAEAEKLLAVGDLGTLLKEAERLDFLRANTTGPVELVHRDVIENNSYVLMQDIATLIAGRDFSKPILLADFPEPVRSRFADALATSQDVGRVVREQGMNLQIVLRPAAYWTTEPPLPGLSRTRTVDAGLLRPEKILPATHPSREGRIESFGSSTVAVPEKPLRSSRQRVGDKQLVVLAGSASSDLQRARKAAAIWKTVEDRLARQRAEVAERWVAMLLDDFGRAGALEGFVGNRARFDSLNPTMLRFLQKQNDWSQLADARPDIVLRSPWIEVLIEGQPRSWTGLPLERLLSGH
ncbi:MAG: hypothetical protein H3C58_08490 [Fimbriimonadaceae bacterium]|nr:hypothetical protein [Fimbriimonadaceae bacterium]